MVRQELFGLEIRKDGNGSKYIQWDQESGGWKRASIQHRQGSDKDWAGTGRYLLVARAGGPEEGSTQGPDFPIISSLSDEQILVSFVHTISAITGCSLI